MPETDYSGYYEPNPLSKIKDIEDKQNLLKDRLLLIGQNLIETKEEHEKKLTDLRKDLEIIKNDIERMKNFIRTISDEMSKFARKEDLEILSKQAKMFQPLDFVRRSELKNLHHNENK